MTLTFITNCIHHHQIPLADEFYKILGNDYKYIACEPLPDWLVKGGYDPNISRPYVLRVYENDNQMKEVLRLAEISDVVIIGSAPDSIIEQRLKDNKITFHYSERWFKHISYHMLSPRLWISIWKNHVKYRRKRSYMLCASAYTASDVNSVFAYPNKCFKWGYFTKVDDDLVVEASKNISTSETLHTLMWCARFLRWKHPELPVKMAARLKAKGYKFVLDMYGSGVELDRMRELAKKLKVEDVISFKGNMPNEEILKAMRKYEIFLFTSDRNEGWGAVTNEAMSNGCTFVGSDKIGAVPFLVKDGYNGCIFKSEDLDSLTEKVEYLLDNPDKRREMAVNAYHTMRNVWSPHNAALNFLKLCTAIENGESWDFIISEGPCSMAK